MTDYIYGSGFVSQNVGGVLLVDSSTLITLSQADSARFGNNTSRFDNLDLLLRSGRQVAITFTVQQEVASDAQVAAGYVDSVRIGNWLQSRGIAVRTATFDTLAGLHPVQELNEAALWGP